MKQRTTKPFDNPEIAAAIDAWIADRTPDRHRPRWHDNEEHLEEWDVTLVDIGDITVDTRRAKATRTPMIAVDTPIAEAYPR